jgi:glycosyltransferase involved in cell wall biosynthesis
MPNLKSSGFDHSIGSVNERKHLKVMFLEPQPCIRALKYAIGLKQNLKGNVSIFFGHIGHSLSDLYGFGEDYFDRIVKIDPDRIDKAIEEFIDENEPDIIHSHNAPDMFTIKAIDAVEDVPIIHDVHEVLSVHKSGFFRNDDEEDLQRYCWEERKACEGSDGRIYATEGIGKYIRQQYDVDRDKDMVFYNYASNSVMPSIFKEKLSARDGEVHLVYVGCLTSLVEDSHYDLREIFKQIADQGLHIHFYPTSNEITESNETYRNLSRLSRFMHYHHPMEYGSLLHEITKYDLGWAGLNRAKNGRHLDIAIQNKIFDYISSGLPIISFPYRAMQHFIEENGVGLIINDVNELSETLKQTDTNRLRQHLVTVRHKLTVENHISELIDFYHRIIEVKGD